VVNINLCKIVNCIDERKRMSIVDSNTVLVIGEGVSAPFDLPLGGEVITKLSEAIKVEISNIYGDDRYGGKLEQHLRAAVSSGLGFSIKVCSSFQITILVSLDLIL